MSIERRTLADMDAKLDWEGREYALTDMSSESMPTPELEALHAVAKAACDAFWERYDDLVADLPESEEEEDE